MGATGEYTLSVRALDGFVELGLQLGIDPNEILASAGIDPGVLSDDSRRIDTAAYRRALDLSAVRSGRDEFGLLLAERQSIGKLGALGFLMEHAETLGAFFALVEAHLGVHDPSIAVSLTVEDGTALAAISARHFPGASDTQNLLLAQGLLVRFVRHVLEPGWSPSVALFEMPRPDQTGHLEAVFRCPLLFNQAMNGIEFPADDLAQPLRFFEPRLCHALEEYLRTIERHEQDGFLSHLRSSILAGLDSPRISLDSTAADMGLTPNQLQRRLRQRDTSFKEQLVDARHQLACHYLRDTTMAMVEISAALGYSEPSAFTRSFQRIAGQSPSQWRRHMSASR